MHRLHRTFAGVFVFALAGACAPALHAQPPRLGITTGLALATEYPARFQEGCGNSISAAPFAQLHHRLHRALTAELGVSAQIQLPPGVHASCGDAVPLQDGDVYRSFTNARGSVSLAGEARVVLTPPVGDGAMLRVIGGGAWYAVRNAPAWIAGLGYRRGTSRGAFVLDIERWSVGVAYDRLRYRAGAPAEPLGDGREWQSFWQLRAGYTLWAH